METTHLRAALAGIFSSHPITFALVACTIVLMQGCTKDRMTELQSQVRERGDKLYHFTVDVNGTKSVIADMADGSLSDDTWDGSDVIRVYNGSGYVDFTYQTTGDYSGTFYNADGIGWDHNCGYVMVYPASVGGETGWAVTDDDLTLTVPVIIPTTQIYNSETTLKNMPMIAIADPLSWGDRIHFKHLCGVLGVTMLDSSDITDGGKSKSAISGISFTAKGCSGAGTVACTRGDSGSFEPELEMNDAVSTTTLVVTEMETSSHVHTYYLYLPAGTYQALSEGTTEEIETSKPTLSVSFGTGESPAIQKASAVHIYRAKLTRATNCFQTLYGGGGNDGNADRLWSDEKPYLIRTAQDLIDLAYNINSTTKAPDGKSWHTGYYKLCNDIDMGGATLSPIGKNDAAGHQFRGCFDGGGFTISNYVIDNSSNNAGLFGYVGEGAQITNLNVKQVSCSVTNTASARSYVGAIAGYAYKAAFTDCEINGKNETGGGASLYGSMYVGGIVGYAVESGLGASDASSRKCNVYGATVYARTNGASYAGGLVGTAEGKCTVSGYVVNADCKIYAFSNIGGLVGHAAPPSGSSASDGTKLSVGNSESHACVEATTFSAGGIIGYAQNQFSISDCSVGPASQTTANGAHIEAGSQAGGLVGFSSVSASEITGSVSVGEVTVKAAGVYAGGSDSSGDYAGGFVGNGSITIVGISGSPLVCGATVLTNGRCAGGLVGYMRGGSISNCKFTGDVTATVYHSGGIAGRIDNDLIEISNCQVGSNGAPCGITTSNVNSATEAPAGGVVGSLLGTGSNVTISGCSVYANVNSGNGGDCLGGVVGCIYQDANGGTIKGCEVNGTVGAKDADNDAVGGMVGRVKEIYSNNSAVVNIGGNVSGDKCCNRAVLNGHQYVGGMIGQLKEVGTITNCENYGPVTATADSCCAGGIVGYAGLTGNDYKQPESSKTMERNIVACTNYADISGKCRVGGICGRLDGSGRIDGCKCTGTITVSGELYVGGIAGAIINSSYISGGTEETEVCGENVTVVAIGDEPEKKYLIVGCGGVVGVIESVNESCASVKNCRFAGKVVSRSAASASDGTGNGCYIGGIAGYASIAGSSQPAQNTIESCSCTGQIISGQGTRIGGIIGNLGWKDSRPYGKLSGCTFSGTLSSSAKGSGQNHNGVGGIVGRLAYNAETSGCTSTGTITLDQSSFNVYIGGIAGFPSNNSRITGCTCDGITITDNCTDANSYSGGIAGFVYNDVEVSDCKVVANRSNTSITGTGKVGGVLGHLKADGGTPACSDCWVGRDDGSSYTTTITGSGNNPVGGVIGWLNDGTVNGCYSKNNSGVSVKNTCTSSSASATSSACVGAVVGYMGGGMLCGIAPSAGVNTATTSQQTGGTVTATGAYVPAGGVVGRLNGGTIANYDDRAQVDGIYVSGGIAGEIKTYGGKIYKCNCQYKVTASTSIASSDYHDFNEGCAGGIVGLIDSPTSATEIKYCSLGNITANAVFKGQFCSGGVVGRVVMSSGAVTLDHISCISPTVALAGTGWSYMGGAVGFLKADASGATGTFTLSNGHFSPRFVLPQNGTGAGPWAISNNKPIGGIIGYAKGGSNAKLTLQKLYSLFATKTASTDYNVYNGAVASGNAVNFGEKMKYVCGMIGFLDNYVKANANFTHVFCWDSGFIHYPLTQKNSSGDEYRFSATAGSDQNIWDAVPVADRDDLIYTTSNCWSYTPASMYKEGGTMNATYLKWGSSVDKIYDYYPGWIYDTLLKMTLSL